MRKPSKYEKETIVNFNEAEQEATIYTFNAEVAVKIGEPFFTGFLLNFACKPQKPVLRFRVNRQ